MKVHFLGIGGSGESAVAAIAKSQGYEISGCDKDLNSEFLKPFKDINISQGHSRRHLEGAQQALLVITPAILSLDPNNEELVEARILNIPVLTWQQFLGKYLLKDKFVIAVAGTHGKTTTTAMIAQILVDSGLDPTVELGAINPKWGSNFRIGKSKYFVLEADEFNNNFLNYQPDLSVVTNIEFDHPEFFKDFKRYSESFVKFLTQTQKKIFANLSDPVESKLLHFHPKGVRQNMEEIFKPIVDYSDKLIDFPLKVVGDFNKLNASAAFQVGLTLGIDPNLIRNSLMNYAGVDRRFEYLGKFKGADIYSDFAHHPTEVKVTLEAARKKFPSKRIWVIFQPHMFTRTKALFGDFVRVLKNAPIEQVSFVDIYPSREVDMGLVSSKELVEAIDKRNVSYLGSIKDVEGFVKNAARKEDIIIFMGAGDIDKIARSLTKENA